MSDSSSVNSFDMVKDECGSLSDFDAPEVVVEKSPEMEKLMELVEQELKESDDESESESESESDDESDVLAESTDESESDAEPVVEDELLVELMKPLAESDQKILKPVTIDIPEPVPDVKELVIPEGKVLVDAEILEEIKLLREPKEPVIPEGKVLITENEREELTSLRIAEHDYKIIVKEQSTKLRKLTAEAKELNEKVDSQTKVIEKLRLHDTTQSLTGKWRLISMKALFAKDTDNGAAIARRFLNLVAPMHISLDDKQVTMWQQCCGKRFNVTSTGFAIPELAVMPKMFEAKYFRDDSEISVYWTESPVLELSTGQKVYLDREDLLMSSFGDSARFMAYKKVQKKTDIFRAVWKAAQTVTGKYF